MATHKLPPRTKNLTVNLPEVSKLAFGLLSYSRGKYVGEMVREMIAEQLEIGLARGEIARHVALKAIRAMKTPLLIFIGIFSLMGALPRNGRRISGARGSVVTMVRAHRKVDGNGWEVLA